MTTTTIVTGASAGIGRAVALRLGAEGMNVAVGYHSGRRRAGDVAEAITEAGGRAVAVRADVSRRADVTALFDRAELYGMREAARRLRTGGGIVNLSTTALAAATPGLGVYQAGKAGVEALTRVLAKELGARGIRVNAVAPGLVDSPMFREGKTDEDVERFTATAPLRRLGRFDEIAATVAYLLGSDASWVNGQVLRVNGGVG